MSNNERMINITYHGNYFTFGGIPKTRADTLDCELEREKKRKNKQN